VHNQGRQLLPQAQARGLPDGGGSEESLIFGSVGAFATRSVAFIDVIVTDASYTSTPNSASESFTETWQFWGSGTPT